MYHEEFYLNRRTGEKAYNWNQAVKWIVSGDKVLDKLCLVMVT